VGPRLSTVLLDTHVLHWLSAEPERLSPEANAALDGAEELAVADVTWFELAWLARNERITLEIPLRSWLERLAAGVRTVPIAPAVAEIAVGLPSSFPGDPADRLIFATAVEHGWRLVTKDRRILDHPHPRKLAVW
jgi:PIN domain nuclease of toxin-antitoxin system